VKEDDNANNADEGEYGKEEDPYGEQAGDPDDKYGNQGDDADEGEYGAEKDPYGEEKEPV